jgi:hypothetical protein
MYENSFNMLGFHDFLLIKGLNKMAGLNKKDCILTKYPLYQCCKL